ncbi:hypothetical protein RFI_15360 [Reticulomyxa filosa]|uniref:Uncharacterized protein n=1 Tax=Reticulomyxa filosa TaxID=46433 RepID=X6N735_RETFI|nr:hypothetical protein RFI_15360 [Reticulomyxa filosa]|eukprot:ETO21841.1 hypothetical protein RFI_15360 [Reticulomyxa filosa]
MAQRGVNMNGFKSQLAQIEEELATCEKKIAPYVTFSESESLVKYMKRVAENENKKEIESSILQGKLYDEYSVLKLKSKRMQMMKTKDDNWMDHKSITNISNISNNSMKWNKQTLKLSAKDNKVQSIKWKNKQIKDYKNSMLYESSNESTESSEDEDIN